MALDPHEKSRTSRLKAALMVVAILGCLTASVFLVALAVFNWRADRVAPRSPPGAVAGSIAGEGGWAAGPQIGRALSACDLPRSGTFRLSIFLLDSKAIELAMVPADTRLDRAQIRCLRRRLAGLPLRGSLLTGVVNLIARYEAGGVSVDLVR